MTDAPAIPTGPIDREPLAYPGDHYPTATEKTAILHDTLAAAGVELGAYDDRIITWFAEFADWSTLAVIASWVRRAAG
ncbi:hypothetical protein [Streptomyces canus]|uniref:hypothetical protein n=1 Tax=Streptomyces canus TaxID=58343 RepID=UPI00381F81B2